MEEKLIKDFMVGSDNHFPDGGSISNISTAGEWVMFDARSECGYYNEPRMISLLEVVAWVYSKQANT